MVDDFLSYETRFAKRATEKKRRVKHTDHSVEDLFVGHIDDKAIVIEKNYGIFKVFYNNEIISGVKLRRGIGVKYFGAIVPGDYVSLVKDAQGYCISNIQKRVSKISRMRQDRTGRGAEYEHIIAANIDAVIAVVSARSPPLHINVIDRYIVMIQSNNIEPIICLNKADLAEGHEDALLKEYRSLGIKYVKTSTLKKEGIEELKKMISGKTAVFIGQSGVGKSSLINAIAGDMIAREGEVSKKTDKGKHTTTASTLYKWRENSYIIDTPGIRSFGIGNIPKKELRLYFPEFKAYVCNYGNCMHNLESAKDCGVKRALAEGKIQKARYDSYLRLLEE